MMIMLKTLAATAVDRLLHLQHAHEHHVDRDRCRSTEARAGEGVIHVSNEAPEDRWPSAG